MCEFVQAAYALSRRSFLTGAASVAGAATAAAGALGTAHVIAPAMAQTARGVPLGAPAPGAYRTRLVLLGTSGGPAWYPGNTRRMISSAVGVGDAVYLIDCGEGWGPQLRRSTLAGPVGALDNLRAVFLTHLHSDHTIDYPNLFVLGLYNGLAGHPQPVAIYGPGRRGRLEPVFGHRAVAPAVVNPRNPTPGTVDMTDALLAAFATDLNDRMRDNLRPDPRTLIAVHDIALPAGTGDDPDGNPTPPIDPFPVYEDDNVRVSATLVYHAPIFPAFAFRFDTADGAIVFSGDTGTRGRTNLAKLAHGADILVHEVIDGEWVNGLFPLPHTPEQAALVNHLLSAHTEIGDVGATAQAAGAKTLVLSHLVPGTSPDSRWVLAQRGFTGRLVIGEDLLEVGVGRPRASG